MYEVWRIKRCGCNEYLIYVLEEKDIKRTKEFEILIEYFEGMSDCDFNLVGYIDKWDKKEQEIVDLCLKKVSISRQIYTYVDDIILENLKEIKKIGKSIDDFLSDYDTEQNFVSSAVKALFDNIIG